MPEEALRLQACRETVIVLGEGNRGLAAFGLADQPRPEAQGAIEALRRAGVERVVMLTSDSEQVAANVSAQVGIDEYRAGLLPEDKLTAVQDLGREAGPVALIGDGINDAPRSRPRR